VIFAAFDRVAQLVEQRTFEGPGRFRSGFLFVPMSPPESDSSVHSTRFDPVESGSGLRGPPPKSTPPSGRHLLARVCSLRIAPDGRLSSRTLTIPLTASMRSVPVLCAGTRVLIALLNAQVRRRSCGDFAHQLSVCIERLLHEPQYGGQLRPSLDTTS